ncbi:MAG: hypothetical protein AB1898_27075 [Acidobacteriota bacterium]
MKLSSVSALLLFLASIMPARVGEVWAADNSAAQGPKPRTDPQILSVFPMASARGTTMQIEIRGKNLEGSHAVWFGEASPVSAKIIRCQEAQAAESKPSPKTDSFFQLTAELSIPKETVPGTHALRILADGGISNPLPFVVHGQPVLLESDLPKVSDLKAFLLPAPPIVVAAKLGQPGEVDSFAFDVQDGEELFFEVFSEPKLDLQLSLYASSGSWFDPARLTRLAFNDEPNSTSRDRRPELSWQFERKGRYVVQVGAFLGTGGPDHSYQLRIAGTKGASTHISEILDGNVRWQERSFVRRLGLDRLKSLSGRTVVTERDRQIANELKATGVTASEVQGGERVNVIAPAPTTQGELTFVSESDAGPPLDRISIPALVEGVIEHPADVDRYRFQVRDSELLAFEIETPARQAPFFIPRLAVFDEAGHEVLNNIYAFVQGSGEFIEKVVEAKVTYRFERGGDYQLEIRDLTSRNGGTDFRYRVAVRQQVPHVGRIEATSSFRRTFDGSIVTGPDVDQLNLLPGEARKITVLTEQEEGFDGQVALTVTGLPPGVQSYPATESEPERAAPLDVGKKERFRPEQQIATIVVRALPDAAPTAVPHPMRLEATPIVNGQPGSVLPVRTIPVMVLRSDR